MDKYNKLMESILNNVNKNTLKSDYSSLSLLDEITFYENEGCILNNKVGIIESSI